MGYLYKGLFSEAVENLFMCYQIHSEVVLRYVKGFNMKKHSSKSSSGFKITQGCVKC